MGCTKSDRGSCKAAWNDVKEELPMFRTALTVLVLATAAAIAGDKVTPDNPVKLPPLPAGISKALPYVQAVHQILDSVSSRDLPAITQVKKTSIESRSEWVVHRVKANVWVERTTTNYLGELEVKVSVPCLIEFGFDLSSLTPERFHFDARRRLLIVDLPDVYVREPVPLLSEMKIEPRYKGLRNLVLDADSMRRLQADVLQQDYQPAARNAGASELVVAQRKARDMMQGFLQELFRKAHVDVEVIVR
jgi:hypothetical protein